MNMFGIAGIVMLAMSVGYLFGRRWTLVQWRGQIDTDAEVNLSEATKQESCLTERSNEKRKADSARQIGKCEVVASPVTGRLDILEDVGSKGVVILPEEGNVYAPVSGKITKLYPMGNAFTIRMEDRTELQVRVGGHPDELCAMYFCPRVIQNEIVNKGKLLLVFDREHLLEAGEDAAVTVRVEEGMNESEVLITAASRVKVGDSVMQLYKEES